MDIKDLKTFIALARTHSFSETAYRLHITQPAVSKRIQSLEDSFHTKLVERRPRKILLTQAGEVLLARAESILREIDNTREEIQRLNQTVSGKLKLATSHHIGLHRLPEIIKRFSQHYPDVEFDLRFTGSEEAEDAVYSAEVEMAIITLPEGLQKPDLTYTGLWQDDLYFVAAPSHPLAETPKATLDDLTGFKAILPDTETFTFKKISKIFEEANCELQLALPTNYLETIKMMVSVGLGWGVLPKVMLDDSLRALDLGVCLSRPLGVVTDPRRIQSSAAAAFQSLLAETAEATEKPDNGTLTPSFKGQ